MKDQYNIPYSELMEEIVLPQRRKEVALQTLAVLKDALIGKSLKQLRCLEIGTSSGIIAYILAQHFELVEGIDIDTTAAKEWMKYKKKNLKFYHMDAQKMKFEANTYDVVIANQDYEFVKNVNKFMKEIHRVLKPGGVCFFGARNKWTLLEGQYAIPFLSWLPEKVARMYLRVMGRKKYFLANYKSYWGLRRLCRNFVIKDYTIKILKNPQKFHFKRLQKYTIITKFIPTTVLQAVEFIVPNYIWVLAKTK